MGCLLIVDLFGEQTVQVITALLQAACPLLMATLVVLLSVRAARAGYMPARVAAPLQIRLSPSDGMSRLADQVLRCELPARAPPDPDDRHAQPTGVRPGE